MPHSLDSTAHDETALAPRKASNWPLIAALGLIAGMAPLSIDMYLPTFPTLGQEFQATAAQIQLTLSGFMLGFCLGQLAYGPISDRFGRRPLLLSGVVLYIVMSILCATATSVEQLTVFRFFQAIGGGAGTVLSRAIVRDLFKGPQMARVMTAMLTVVLFAPMVAPLIGGHMLVWFGWRAVFWTLVACGILALAVVYFRIPESLPYDRRTPPGFKPVMRGYARVIGHRSALGYILSGGITFGALFAFISGAPFVFIEYFGVPPEQMGYIFMINVAGVMTGGWLNGRVIAKYGVRRMMTVGTTMLFGGAVLLTIILATGFGGLWGAMLGVFLFTLPINMINANATTGALEYFPQIAGTASALVGAVRFGCGGIAGFAVGLIHDGTPMPMTYVIVGCALASVILLQALVRK